MTLGPCKQSFKMFSEGLKVSSRSDIQATWGMARASLSGSEPGADLSAWLAKIMAPLSSSTALSRAVCITTARGQQAQQFRHECLYRTQDTAILNKNCTSLHCCPEIMYICFKNTNLELFYLSFRHLSPSWMRKVGGMVQLQTIKVIKFTDWFFGTPKSIGIGR